MSQGKAITIDPLTRVEGHLGIKVDIEDGKVSKAWVMGEMYRGFEKILIGRHPLDAQQMIQRICGVCPVSHGISSILSQDMAYGIQLPDNGRIIRNLVQGANWLQDHITHFYILSSLDFIDVAAVLQYKGKDAILNKMKDWVTSQMNSRQVIPAAPFLPRYEGQYITDLDTNLSAVKHYAQGLEMRAMGHQMGASWVGKLPHAPGLVPGGVTCELTIKDIIQYSSMLDKMKTFIKGPMYEDLLAICKTFPEYWDLGQTYGDFMCFGVFPETQDPTSTYFPPGVLRGGKLEKLDLTKMIEFNKYSKFKAETTGLHPTKGETEADPKKDGAYSWIKTPRYDGLPMEVGPIARVMVAYESGQRPEFNKLFDGFFEEVNQPIEKMNSTLGRHVARVLELNLLMDQLEKWVNQIRPGKPVCVKYDIPAKGEGVGLTEAARGGLAHWIQIDKSMISRYQCIVPSTWTFSPRDDNDVAGPVEKALIGTPIADPDNPIEATRVVRSFDSCLACAVH